MLLRKFGQIMLLLALSLEITHYSHRLAVSSEQGFLTLPLHKELQLEVESGAMLWTQLRQGS